ncbi:unnamed protein product [Amoebophrya sp. A120]|nr:unnamed protein product [Amoebophrya sp. A120]|eukprot:GSA120T00002198001.1
MMHESPVAGHQHAPVLGKAANANSIVDRSDPHTVSTRSAANVKENYVDQDRPRRSRDQLCFGCVPLPLACFLHTVLLLLVDIVFFLLGFHGTMGFGTTSRGGVAGATATASGTTTAGVAHQTSVYLQLLVSCSFSATGSWGIYAGKKQPYLAFVLSLVFYHWPAKVLRLCAACELLSVAEGASSLFNVVPASTRAGAVGFLLDVGAAVSEFCLATYLLLVHHRYISYTASASGASCKNRSKPEEDDQADEDGNGSEEQSLLDEEVDTTTSSARSGRPSTDVDEEQEVRLLMIPPSTAPDDLPEGQLQSEYGVRPVQLAGNNRRLDLRAFLDERRFFGFDQDLVPYATLTGEESFSFYDLSRLNLSVEYIPEEEDPHDLSDFLAATFLGGLEETPMPSRASPTSSPRGGSTIAVVER